MWPLAREGCDHLFSVRRGNVEPKLIPTITARVLSKTEQGLKISKRFAEFGRQLWTGLAIAGGIATVEINAQERAAGLTIPVGAQSYTSW